MEEGLTLNDRSFREHLNELLSHRFVEKDSSRGREWYRLPLNWSAATIRRDVLGEGAATGSASAASASSSSSAAADDS